MLVNRNKLVTNPPKPENKENTSTATQESTTLEASTTTFASVSPANVVTALPAIFFTGTPYGVSPNYGTAFGGISFTPNAFGPTPSPLTRIGRSTVDYGNLSNEVSTEAYLEAISGRTIEAVSETTVPDTKIKTDAKSALKASINQIKNLPKLKTIKKGGLFGRKRPNFLKTFTNKIAAKEKNERDLLDSFKGVNNNIINPNKLTLQTSKKNLSAPKKKSPINPVLRPRRKLQLGLKLSSLKDLTKTKSTIVDDGLKENNAITNLASLAPSDVSSDVNNDTNIATTKASTLNNTQDLTTVTTSKQTTSFMPTPPPTRKGKGKFPFSFKGPLKPKLLSFSIEKYKNNKKKKSSHKFSTKVKKQLSDKLKELRGFNKSKVADAPNGDDAATSESKPIKTNVSTDANIASNKLGPTSTEAFTATEQTKIVNPFDRSNLLRNKLKKGRKSFGSKVNNLFAKKSLKKFSLFAPTKAPKINPSTNTLSLTTTPLHPNTQVGLQDEKSSHDKVVFFILKP